jgi:hypothetical protein
LYFLFTNYNGHRYIFLRRNPFFQGGGRKVFSHAPNSALILLELRKERKKQESLVFKELTCPGLYFENLTN